MIGMEFAKRTEGALPRLTRVTVAVAMVALLALAGCAMEEEPVGAETPSSEVVGDAPEQDATDTSAEPEQEAQTLETESAVSVLEGYSWDELSRISTEIAAAENEEAAIEVAKRYELCTSDGRLDGTQMKSVTLADGTQTTVQIVGFAHDNKTEGGKAGITFIFGDCVGEAPMNGEPTNTGGWESSQMRAYLNGDWRAQLPEDLSAVIVPVDKLANNGEKNGEPTEDVSLVTTTSDSLWLFSYAELAGPISAEELGGASYEQVADIFNAEGTCYKLFSDMGVIGDDGNSVLVKNFQGSPSRWWERSPYPWHFSYFRQVEFSGWPMGGDSAEFSHGVVPGFCI